MNTYEVTDSNDRKEAIRAEAIKVDSYRNLVLWANGQIVAIFSDWSKAVMIPKRFEVSNE